jgi:hypothetical protein
VDIDVTNHYPDGVEQVMNLLGDATFVTARAEHLGHTNMHVLSCGEVGDAHVLHYRREVTVTVPAFAARVLTPRLTVEQRDEWSPQHATAGGYTGTWSVRVRGLPVEMHGEMSLRPDGTGSALQLTGDLHVGIPLIGRRLRPYLISDTLATIEAERVFTVKTLEHAS